MMIAITTLLGAGDWVGAVVVVVALVMWGLSKVNKSPGGPARPGGTAGGLAGSGTTTGSTPSDADELARQRRQQLEALARQRAAGRSAAQPTNLTMDQLRQRAQAKLEYERRVAALKAGANPSAGAQVSSPPTSASAQFPSADLAEAAEAARLQQERADLARRRMAQLNAQQQAQRTAAPARPTRQVPPPPAARAPTQPRRSGIGKPLRSALRQTELVELEEEAPVHRVVADVAGTPASPAALTSAGLPPPTPQLLRQMILWREILSPPLALRTEEPVN